jgi:hypothetical protein
MIESIVKPLQPLHQARNEWFREPLPYEYVARMGYPIERWLHYGTDICVLTAVEVATDKDGSSNGPEYHVSVSKATWPSGRYTPTRIDTNEAKWVLAEFGLDGAEEDNHVPHGVVRNFWRPVASGLVGKECQCKAEEVVIKEMKGDFIWRP